jgi:hypothetical protein
MWRRYVWRGKSSGQSQYVIVEEDKRIVGRGSGLGDWMSGELDVGGSD